MDMLEAFKSLMMELEYFDYTQIDVAACLALCIQFCALREKNNSWFPFRVLIYVCKSCVGKNRIFIDVIIKLFVNLIFK